MTAKRTKHQVEVDGTVHLTTHYLRAIRIGGRTLCALDYSIISTKPEWKTLCGLLDVLKPSHCISPIRILSLQKAKHARTLGNLRRLQLSALAQSG